MKFVECVKLSEWNTETDSLFVDLGEIQAVAIGEKYGVLYMKSDTRWFMVTIKDAKRITEELQIIERAKP